MASRGVCKPTARLLFAPSRQLLHGNMFGTGYPIKVEGKTNLQNRHADALDWRRMPPEWFWDRGGYEPMGNMPVQWQKDGFGDFLVSLTDREIEMLVHDVLHDILLEENLRDGLDLRAPHPETGTPLYSKIPSWLMHSQGWSRPDLRERIFDRVCKAFRIVPPFGQRREITHPVHLVSWLVARVAFARPPLSKRHKIPKDAKQFLDSYPRQPNLGFLLALPQKARTPLEDALNRKKFDEIDADFEYQPKPQGEDMEAMGKHMYWLEMDRRRNQELEEEAARKAERARLIEARRERKRAQSA
eukprot:TRINITY_DN30485_c0_g1_i1.p1 TRINITY_DN30485_c0_g1~~TRINITY_DN30485_c0_g1_i1.p1  ORF type:complete len:301 (+),score=88.46 TRINITY_DN30485_c0_g1_i1:100-1002(+)